jgi:hypothetical protein
MPPKTIILITIAALGAVLLSIITILPYFKILPRLGYNKWFALLMLVPLANIIFLYVVAFAEPPMPSGTITNP